MVNLPIAAGVAGALVLSGGLVCFSKDSLPGDALYSIKTSVAEPVRELLAVSPEAEARVDADIAAERLDDGARAAVRGTLTSEQAAELADAFLVASAEAQQDEAEIATSESGRGEAEIAAELAADHEALIDGFVDLLATLRVEADGDLADAIARLEAEAKAEAKDVKALRVALQAGVDKAGLEADARLRLKAAEDAIVRAKASIAAQRAGLDATAAADAEARLKAAEHLLVDGKAKLDAGAHVQAADMFKAADRFAADAALYGDLLLDLQADLRGHEQEILDSVRANGGTGVRVNLDGTVDYGTGSGSTGGGTGANVNANVNGGANVNANTNLNTNVNVNVNGVLNANVRL